MRAHEATFLCSYLTAQDKIRGIGGEIPSSLDLLAELRRARVVASRVDVFAAALAHGLQLSDAPWGDYSGGAWERIR